MKNQQNKLNKDWLSVVSLCIGIASISLWYRNQQPDWHAGLFFTFNILPILAIISGVLAIKRKSNKLIAAIGIMIGIAFLILPFVKMPAGSREVKQAETKTAVTDDKAIQIIQYLYTKKPIFALDIQSGSDSYIVAAIRDGQFNEPRLLVLKQIADLWQEQPQQFKLFCTLDDCPSNAKKIELSGQQFVYFTTESFGNTLGNMDFCLFSPSEMHLYKIGVMGTVKSYSTIGTITEDIKSNKAVYDYLTQQIAQSKEIAHISEQNLDLNSSQNAVAKWNLDNGGIRVAMNNYAAPVNFTYYDDNLFDQQGSSITGSIENEQYKIKSYFKSVVVGFNKITNKYFIIWVPDNIYEWPTDIVFTGLNSVYIKSANSGPTVSVNLDTKTISTQ